MLQATVPEKDFYQTHDLKYLFVTFETVGRYIFCCQHRLSEDCILPSLLMRTLTLYKISLADIKLIKIRLTERLQKATANVEFLPSNLFLMGRDGGAAIACLGLILFGTFQNN